MIAVYGNLKTETTWKCKKKIIEFTTNILYYYRASVVFYYTTLCWNGYTKKDRCCYSLNGPLCNLYT